MLGLVLLALDGNRRRVDEPAEAGDVVDPAVRDVPVPISVDIADEALAAVNELAPVGPPAPGCDTEIACVVDSKSDVGGVPHDFFRHAAVVDAGAADPAAFDDCHFSAQLGRGLGRGQSAAAATDHD